MDQSEIDALLNAGGKPSKAPKAAAAPKPAPAPPPVPAPPVRPVAEVKPDAAEVKPDSEGHVLSEIDAVTAVTERETNKVMDQLDVIGQLVTRQQNLITEILAHPGTQDPAIQTAINQIMGAAKDIQDKVFEAMDLMQFQDITRQKLERIVHHLRQIHDYIIDLLGTGVKNDPAKVSISRTIVQTGTTPDERKAHADAVIEEFRRSDKKKD